MALDDYANVTESQKFDEIRRNRISELVNKGKNIEEETKNSSENVTPEKKDEKKLDNKEKNSYINNDNSNKESDQLNDEVEAIKKIYENQFKGDPLKAVKSWQHNQSEYMKLQEKSKEAFQTIQGLQELISKNPVLADIIERAETNELNVEQLQSFLNGKVESNVDKPKEPLESKPHRNNDTKIIDESNLVNEGYLDSSQKNLVSSSEWNLMVRQAQLQYMADKQPEVIAERAAKKFQEQIAAEQAKQKEAQDATRRNNLNIERRDKGIVKVVSDFGLDFAGNEDHRKLLDEIIRDASYIIDPQNPGVIREDAIYLATIGVMNRHGIQPQTPDNSVENQARNEVQRLAGANTFNTNKGIEQNKSPKTLAEEIRNRRISQYQNTMSKRTNA